jgi:tRNA nucleotidyltransferase (CCA-adding enzyme)
MSSIHISNEKINHYAIDICSILQKHGYQAYIVGGCVRDLILGKQPKDWDICTDAKPEKVMELFPKHYPTGLKHGTITVAMAEGVENNFEVTTFRVEGKYTDGRRPEEVSFVSNVIEDLARRDLTINAMAYDPLAKIILDPFYGQQDIKWGFIQAVGNANDRFQEDGLRIMRAARFAARFEYIIESKTFEAMCNNLPTLAKVSVERIKDELCKTLMTNNPYLGIKYLQDCGALQQICPEITLTEALEKCKGGLETKIACLFTHTTFTIAERAMISLKFSNNEIKKVKLLLQLFEWTSADWSTTKVYRKFMAFLKNQAQEDWQDILREFIHLSEAFGRDVKTTLEACKNEIVWARKEMAINGDDLIELGIKPGPELKKLLDRCYEEILEHPEKNTLEHLSTIVKTISL